ncbi:hypothetical protein ACP0FU_26200, partial [Escherichia coli]
RIIFEEQDSFLKIQKHKNIYELLNHTNKFLSKTLKKDDKFYKLGDLNSLDTTVVEEFVGKSRAFIKIQEGCDFRCSYCIIP